MQPFFRSSLLIIGLFFACLVSFARETGDTLQSVPLNHTPLKLDSLRLPTLPTTLRSLENLTYHSNEREKLTLPLAWNGLDSLGRKYLPPIATDLLHLNFRALSHQSYGLIPILFPKKKAKEDRWRNIPADCRIDWKRHREHFLWDLGNDIATYFNTFDTTYIERTRYDFQVKLYNTHFLQLIRLSGTDATGSTQSLTFAPAHEVKLGPYFAWKALSIGYSFGVVPDRFGSRASEFNFASYNSKLGFDLNYIYSRGNFNLIGISGFDSLQTHSISQQRFPAMRTKTLALNLYYVFNYRHFSYPAAFAMSTVQLRSAGSWLMGLRFDRQDMAFDAERTESFLRTIAPHVTINDALRVSNIAYRQWGVSFGYAYNWVPTRHWLVSASLAPSIGYKYQSGESLSARVLWKNVENFHMDFIFRGALVHTNGRRYLGISTVNYLYDYRHAGFSLNNSIHYIQLFFGWYFGRKPMFRGEKPT